MNTALEYSTRVVQEGGRRCEKSTLNDLVHLTTLRISLMNPPCDCGGGGCFEIYCGPYSAGVLHSVSDQIQNLQNCFITPNKNYQ
jgi:hypothetical protein